MGPSGPRRLRTDPVHLLAFLENFVLKFLHLGVQDKLPGRFGIIPELGPNKIPGKRVFDLVIGVRPFPSCILLLPNWHLSSITPASEIVGSNVLLLHFFPPLPQLLLSSSGFYGREFFKILFGNAGPHFVDLVETGTFFLNHLPNKIGRAHV